MLRLLLSNVRWNALVLNLLILAASAINYGSGSSLRRHTQEFDSDYGNLQSPLMTPLMEEQTIIGGVPAKEGEFPFFVVFEGSTLCGGNLISPNRVLTAAHCIKDTGWPQFVRVGATNKSNGKRVKVRCGVFHKDYISPFVTVVNDIAILKLETNVTFANSSLNASNVTSANASKHAVWNTDQTFPSVEGHNLTVVGFGKLSNNGGSSSTLQKVGTFYVPKAKCVETYTEAVVRPNAHMCADVPNKGDCNGDSGGPLMDTATGVQVGIVSFGYGGCASEYQDVYTKVAFYDAWIREQVEDDTCPATGAGSSGGGGGCFSEGVATVGYAASVSYDRMVNLASSVTSVFTGGN